MSIGIAIACIIPLLLITWRSEREPRWLGYVRYLVAVLVVWQVVMMLVSQDTMIRVREARENGDIERASADTGPNAAAFMFGWIPGLAYAALIGTARWCWLRLRGNGPTHKPGSSAKASA